jgi:hypothetical protein
VTLSRAHPRSSRSLQSEVATYCSIACKARPPPSLRCPLACDACPLAVFRRPGPHPLHAALQVARVGADACLIPPEVPEVAQASPAHGREARPVRAATLKRKAGFDRRAPTVNGLAAASASACELAAALFRRANAL